MKRKKTLLCLLIATIFLMPLMGNTALGESTVIYYFNSYDINTAWETNPGYMVDGSENTHAKTTIDGDIQLLDGNTLGLPPGVGDIGIVELSVKACSDISIGNYVNLTPVFGGTTDGIEITNTVNQADTWSEWFDITNDPNGPGRWSWDDIANLDCKVIAGVREGSYVNCSKVRIRVTYGE